MQRWERTQEGRAERWELTRERSTITERIEIEGSEPLVRSARCDTEAMAMSIAARMIARQERAGFARVGEPAPANVERPAARPSYPGLTDAQLDALINGVEKAIAGDAYKIGSAIQKVVGDWQGRVPAAWFLVAHRLVAAERMPGLWSLLAEQPAQVQPEALLELLVRLPTGGAFAKLFKGGMPVWFTPGFERALDELLFAAYQRAPALFDAREGELPKTVREALDFVRGRSGREVPPERAGLILRHMGKAQCERGLASNCELARLAEGRLVRPRVGTLDDVRAIAACFGTHEAWREAMVEAVKAAPELSLHTQYDGLLACELGVLTAKLASAFSFSDNTNLARILALLAARADAPEALLAAASSITRNERHALEVRDMLAVIAAGRCGARGEAVPESLDALLDLSFFSGVYFESLAPYVLGMAALPRERALGLAERKLAEPHLYAAGLAPLLAHPDEALLTRFFDRDAPNAYLDPLVVGRFGAAALPHLARVWEATPRASRRTRHKQVLEALATMGDRGECAEPEWDRFVTFHQEGDQALEYWDPSYAKVRARALAALPIERRTAQLLTCVRSRPFPERALAAAATLDDAGLAVVVEAFLPRRSEAGPNGAQNALRSLASRLVAPLRAQRSQFAGDAGFTDVLAGALPPELVAAIWAD